MKKILIVTIIAVIMFVAISAFNSESLIGDDIILFAYTVNDTPNGGASMSVPFNYSDESRFINIALDLNGDSSIAAYDIDGVQQQEWVVQNGRPRIFSDTRNLMHFNLSDVSALNKTELSVFIAVGADRITSAWDGSEPDSNSYFSGSARVESYELADILGLNVPGGGPDVYRGSAVSAWLTSFLPLARAQTQNPDIDVYSDLEIPDLPQESMECAPTSAANNLIGLAASHGQRDNLPQNPRDIIDELKNDMNFDNGVVGADTFKNGKDAFVARYNLPIETTIIENPKMDDFVTAIVNDCAIEMDLAFIDVNQGNKHVASHVVSVTGAYRDGADEGLSGVDSATPDGIEEWTFSGAGRYTQISYPTWSGATIVTRIFVQCWLDDTSNTSVIGTDTQSETTTTGSVQNDGSQTTESSTIDTIGTTGTTQQGTAIEMLLIGSAYYPKQQFSTAGPDNCEADHYHADETVYGFVSKTSTQIVSITDQNPRECGFGEVNGVPTETVTISYEQSVELIKYLVD